MRQYIPRAWRLPLSIHEQNPDLSLGETSLSFLHTNKYTTNAAKKIIKGGKGDRGFPDGSVVKNLLANARDMGSIPELRRSSGEGNGHPLHSCLGNPMDKGAWRATVHGLQKSEI